jgi:hypothetical protein
MIHAVGLFEPNAFSRTFKPGTLIRPGNHILSRRGVACVNGAQHRLRISVTVLVPSCRSDPLSGVRATHRATGPPARWAHAEESRPARNAKDAPCPRSPGDHISPLGRVSLPPRKPGIAVVAPSYVPCRYRGARGVSEAVSARGPGLHCVPQRVRSGPQDAPNSI